MEVIKRTVIDTTTKREDIMRGLGNYYEKKSDALLEFIDNSVGLIVSEGKKDGNIKINIEECTSNIELIKIGILDNICGVDDLKVLIGLGKRGVNLHSFSVYGFGCKHAIAALDETDKNWIIYTVTKEDIKKNQYRYIKKLFDGEIYENTISGKCKYIESIGTYIQIKTKKENFINTDNNQMNKIVSSLKEKIGFLYWQVLDKCPMDITVSSNSVKSSRKVKKLSPPWLKQPKILHLDISLDDGRKLPVSFTFGYIKKSNSNDYYKTSIVQSGVCLSINGRIVKENVIDEIWEVKAHQRFNSFRGFLNISADNLDIKLVTTEKRNLILSNKIIQKIFSEIKRQIPTIKPLKKCLTERELRKKMENSLKNENKNIITKKELPVFLKINKNKCFIDIYTYSNDVATMYELKTKKIKVLDISQSIMYWYGAKKFENINLDKIIIVTQDKINDDIDYLVSEINKEFVGKFVLEIKTFKDFKIDVEDFEQVPRYNI